MGRYQFMHVEGYARQAPKKGKAGGHSIRSVMAEAMRDEGAHPHVSEPLPPVILFGAGLAEVEAKATEWADESKDAIGRKLRKDGLALLAGVISCPPEMSDEEWAGYKLDAVAWLARDSRLVSVIEHVDEKERHFHFYKVPLAGERFEDVHPGRKASLEAAAKGEVKGAQNKAYKAAMRAFQDDFYGGVGVKHGLGRIGPGRRRLTREGWVAEQQTSAKIAQAMKAAEVDKAEGTRILAEAKATAKNALEAADAKQLELAAMAAQIEASNKASVEALAVSKRAKESNVKLAVALREQAAQIKADRASLKAEREGLEKFGHRVGIVVGSLTKAAGIVAMAVPRMWQELRWKQAADTEAQKAIGLSQELRQEAEKRAEAETREKRAMLQRDAALENVAKLSGKVAVVEVKPSLEPGVPFGPQQGQGKPRQRRRREP